NIVDSDTWVNVIDNSISFPNLGAFVESISSDTLEFDLTNRPGDPGNPVNYIVVWFNFSYSKDSGKTSVTVPVTIKIPETILNPPKDVLAVQVNEMVKILWEDKKSDVDGYNVYRLNNQGEWKRINKELVIKHSFKDEDVEDGNLYQYKVTSCFGEIESGFSRIAKVRVIINYTDMDHLQTYPNPAKEKVLFDRLPKDACITIYTITGQEVITLYANGSNQVEWRLLNKANRKVSAGIYFYVIVSEKGEKKGKIAITK
ncbi:MAG: T9SS type A sorting domain-containing protein, partial [bacterium]|nr:T9SS type A sorting domain-containing protein [bacterium]